MSPIRSQKFISGQHQCVTTCLYLLGGNLDLIKQRKISVDDQLWKELHGNKSARVIATLCKLRSSVLLHRSQIAPYLASKHTLHGCPSIDASLLGQCDKDKIKYTSWTCVSVVKLVRSLNVELGVKIGTCEAIQNLDHKELVKAMLQMPNGKNDTGVAKRLNRKMRFPACGIGIGYINLPGTYTAQMWNDDSALLKTLRGSAQRHNEQNGKCSEINSYLETEKKVCVFVDCDNVDPFKFCAAMTCITDGLRSHVEKIILICDNRASPAWTNLQKYVSLPIERITVQRAVSQKSRTDGTLIAEAVKRRYTDNIKSIILCSSDSDMWSLVRTLPDTKFLLLLERDKCSPNYKKEISASNARFCMIDGISSPRATYYFAASLISDLDGMTIPISDKLTSTMRALHIKNGEVDYGKLLTIIAANTTIEKNADNTVRLRIRQERVQPALAKLWPGGKHTQEK